jgi:hypothetical protein
MTTYDEVEQVRALAATREQQMLDVTAVLHAKIEALQFGTAATEALKQNEDRLNALLISSTQRHRSDVDKWSEVLESSGRRLETAKQDHFRRLRHLSSEAKAISDRLSAASGDFEESFGPSLSVDHRRRFELLLERVREKCVHELSHELSSSLRLVGNDDGDEEIDGDLSNGTTGGGGSGKKLLKDAILMDLQHELIDDLCRTQLPSIMKRLTVSLAAHAQRESNDPHGLGAGHPSAEDLKDAKEQLDSYDRLIHKYTNWNGEREAIKRNLEKEKQEARIAELRLELKRKQEAAAAVDAVRKDNLEGKPVVPPQLQVEHRTPPPLHLARDGMSATATATSPAALTQENIQRAIVAPNVAVVAENIKKTPPAPSPSALNPLQRRFTDIREIHPQSVVPQQNQHGSRPFPIKQLQGKVSQAEVATLRLLGTGRPSGSTGNPKATLRPELQSSEQEVLKEYRRLRR